ncbi:MAG: SpoIIE family protein phosphatase [Bacteroidetes bacterium]|jgi:ligand-binding sensor domain-containing protein|nr:SpoIIE family protein phosphatase [Bacteroidota bacterium]
MGSFHRYRRLCFAFGLALAVASDPSLLAQSSSAVFRRISLEQGLSQSIVNDILHDRSGFLWFATEEGINIYDGYRFRVLRHEPADPTSLSYNQIVSLMEDRTGAIWVGTFAAGLNVYDPTTGSFRRLRHDPLDTATLSSDIIFCLAQDPSGAVWVGSDRGLDRLTLANGSPVVQRVVSVDGTDYGLAGIVRCLLAAPDGLLWIGTSSGLYTMASSPEGDLVPRKDLRRHVRDPKDPLSIGNDNVRSLLLDRGTNVWVGTDDGLFRAVVRRSADGAERVLFKRISVEGDPARSPVQPQIFALAEDLEGYIWVGTNGGLSRFDRTRFQYEHFRHDPRDSRSLSYNEIRSLHEDRSGNLWIGTYGGGVSQLDRGRKRFTHLRHDPDNPNGLRRPIVWSIYEDGEGILWIGTHGGGLNRYDRRNGSWRAYVHDPRDPRSISHNVVRLVLEDRRGRLWLATDGGGLCEFDRRTGRFRRFAPERDNSGSLGGNVVRMLYEDRAGTLWIGFQGAGMDRLVRDDDGEPLRFEHFRHRPDDPRSVASDQVRWALEDHDGVFWVATLGGGLDRMDRSTGAFTHLRAVEGSSDGLPSDFLMSVMEDTQGRLWAATWGAGISILDRDRQHWLTYDESHGLPSNSIYGFLEDASGRMWMSSNNGLIRFDPRSQAFRNYGVADGLQSIEFDAGAFTKTRKGEMIFGGINGINIFYPEEITDNAYVPPVVLTSVRVLNEEWRFDRPVWDVTQLELGPGDNVVAFQFAALDFTAPERNRYQYRMEGVDEDWLTADPQVRTAQYTTLPPGQYTFRVRASNNDGRWNDAGLVLTVVVRPPWWSTLWFRSLIVLTALAAGFVTVRSRVRDARIAAELHAAHDAQMSIMPHEPLRSAVLEVAGQCVPANEVGGDFFDYRWMDPDKTQAVVMVGDVSGKAMKAAMTAIMTSGALSAEVLKEKPVAEVLTNVNPFVFEKTERKVFVAASLVQIDGRKKTLRFSNAGLIDPMVWREGVVRSLKATGLRHPLGMVRDTVYEEQKSTLRPGDIVVLVSDGVTEARRRDGTFYGEERLVALLERKDLSGLGAAEVVAMILKAVHDFAERTGQHDDMTVVVAKVGG